MHATPNGILYFVDLNDLYKIDHLKKLKLVAGSLEVVGNGERVPLKHDIFGIWLDKDNNIYIAVKGAQVVKKITTAGVVSNFIYSSGNWSPSGGVFDDMGNLWLLESNLSNETRVRKIIIKKFE